MPRHRRGWAISANSQNEDRFTPLMGSILEPALLILLKDHPQHGYTLLESLEALGMNPPHPSVVYRILHEMESLQWVRSQWDADESQGPPRRIYSLTDQGEVALQNWRVEMEKSRDLMNKLIERL